MLVNWKKIRQRPRAPHLHGWYHFYDAYHCRQGFIAKPSQSRPKQVMFWVKGHGVKIGMMFEGTEGLLISIPGMLGKFYVLAWQPCPKCPTTI